MEQKKHLKHLWTAFFLTIFVVWLNCVQTNAQGTTSLYVGQNTLLAAPNPPSGAALNQVAWGCSHKAVSVEKYMTYGAKVTVNEYFTGSAEVRCDYYYYWYDRNGYMHTNNATTYYLIKCYPVNLTVNPTSMSLNVGDSKYITYSYSPSSVSPKPTIRFFSSNTNVASVNQEGRVNAVGSGNATITISNSSGPNATYSVSVKPQRPTGISLPSSLSLVAGESKTITPTVYPSGAQYSLTWTSSDVNVASVSSSGRVTGIKSGSVIITAKINGYDYSDDCYVNVEKKQLTLTANPSGGMLEQGAKVTLTASDTDAAIYYTLDGKTPSRSSTKYTSPITINQSLTLKAIAYHSDYKTSDVLTANYEATSLKVVSINPKNGATDIQRDIVPSVTFNSEIQKGDDFPNIKLLKDGMEEVKGERIISGKTLYFVSQEELGSGNYNLIIPRKSIESYSSEVNFAQELMFTVKGLATETIKKIGGGRMLKTNGEFYLWGSNIFYKYPDPSMKTLDIPTLIYNDIVDYQNGYPNTYVLKNDGTLIGWGGNYNSSSSSTPWGKSCDILGDGTKETRLTPVTILSDVKTMIYGTYHCGAIKKDNTLWKWGRNVSGQIGNGKTEDAGQLYPVKVLDDVKDASFGLFHSAALKYDGTLWVWGAKECIGTSSSQYCPMQKMTKVSAISTGDNYVFVLKDDGTAWTFGENSNGQIGDGTTTNRTTPYKVLSDVQFIEASGSQNIAIKKDGSLWRWGFWCNGFSNRDDRYWLTPRKILNDVVCAHADGFHCFALKNDGTLWGMGDNSQGQLGNGTQEYSISMVKILDGVVKFWRGNGIYAVRSDGSVWGWANSYIGDGSTNLKLTPTKIIDGEATKYPDYVGIDVYEDKAANLPVGEQLVFQTVIKPSDCNYGTITWSIEDNNIATISQRGVVTAKTSGKTTVNLEVNVAGISYVSSHDLTVTGATGIIDVHKSNVKVSVNNSILHIENINGGERVCVHTPAGLCIYNGIVNSRTINIPLRSNGIYIINVGNQTLKAWNY